LTKKTHSPRTEKTRRRRRKPEAAEAEILNAAESFLREFPLREMMVDDVMARTGLSRPSFYEYFRDRNHLVIKLTERLSERNRAITERWFSGDDPVQDLRRTTRDLVEMYVTHGHLLRALADAANNDAEVEASYRKSFDSVIDATAQRIRNHVASGATMLDELDPREIAAALLWMNERYLIEKLGRRPQADPKAVADTLAAIWLRVLHGTSQ
jgi:TetR/AcrR family transcriptional regulator, ethionamide resistance regulator